MATKTEVTISRVLTEDVLTLAQARAELRQITGKRPDKATMTRWIHRGVGGTKLEAVRLGCQLFTSRQALTRFIHDRTEKSVG
jgi:hypothetical protein